MRPSMTMLDILVSRLMGDRYDWKMMTSVITILILWPSAGLVLAQWKIVTWHEYLWHLGTWCMVVSTGILIERLFQGSLNV